MRTGPNWIIVQMLHSFICRLWVEGPSRQCMCCLVRLELQRNLQISREVEIRSRAVWRGRGGSLECSTVKFPFMEKYIANRIITSISFRQLSRSFGSGFSSFKLEQGLWIWKQDSEGLRLSRDECISVCVRVEIICRSSLLYVLREKRATFIGLHFYFIFFYIYRLVFFIYFFFDA